MVGTGFLVGWFGFGGGACCRFSWLAVFVYGFVLQVLGFVLLIVVGFDGFLSICVWCGVGII